MQINFNQGIKTSLMRITTQDQDAVKEALLKRKGIIDILPMITRPLVFGSFLLFLSYAHSSETAFTPEKILANGIDSSLSINPYTGESAEVRKGTIAATINNVAQLNKSLVNNNPKEIEEIVHAIRSLIPSLKAVGMFNFFSTLEWLSSDDQPGRILVAILYLQTYPHEMKPEIKDKLKIIRTMTPISYLTKEIDVILKTSN